MHPCNLQFPRAINSWRAIDSSTSQLDVALSIASSTSRFHLVGAPTGTGKTVINTAAGRLHNSPDERLLYLVYTKALMRQVHHTCPQFSLIEGMSNYECKEVSVTAPYTCCNEGVCTLGQHCDLRESGCNYYDAQRCAGISNETITNFAYYATLSRYRGDDNPLGNYDFVIIDEAHSLVPWMSEFCGIQLRRQQLARLCKIKLPTLLSLTDDPLSWSHWAWEVLPTARDAYEDQKARAQYNPRRYKQVLDELESLGKQLRTLSELHLRYVPNAWVVDREKYGISVTPVDPSAYLEQYMYRGASKVILSSASLSEIDHSSFIHNPTLDYTSVQEYETDYEFHPCGEGFPIANRPVVAYPTTRCSAKMPRAATNTWLARIDEFIQPRLPWRGVVDTVSYDRAELIFNRTKYKEHAILHRRGDNLNSLLQKLYRTPPPCFIITPSLIEGYSLDNDKARWMAITKMPFINPNSKLVQARKRLYKSMGRDYITELCAKGVMQRCGRLVRSVNDWGEVGIFDDNWIRYVRRSSALALWFTKACTVEYRGMRQPLGELRRVA